MSDSPFRNGDFVWTNFPEREDPLRPGPPHVSYMLAVNSMPDRVFAVAAAYTSSQPWLGELPFGVHRFDRYEAERLGQARPFILDLRTIAFLPATSAWFPQLETKEKGVLGRAPEKLRVVLENQAKQLFGRHGELLDRRGPLRPR